MFIPENKVQVLKDTLNEVVNKQKDESAPTYTISESKLNDSNIKLPTFIKTNDFTWTFQQIVDTYGIPRYKEFNPAVFNIVTFPFLFGMMFGDVAHGLILFIFGLYLLLNHKNYSQDPNSMLKSFGPARYLLPMMGFFALFSGFIYNDFASSALPLSPSCYTNKSSYNKETDITTYYAERDTNCNYYFGVDHKWHVSTNDLTFLNSLKMKLSVIIGVMHMSLGIFIKGLNCVYFDDWLSFFFEFVPQFTFMVLIFGYMDFMIIYKWLQDWTGRTFYAPNITSTLLDMFLKLGQVAGDPNDNVSII